MLQSLGSSQRFTLPGLKEYLGRYYDGPLCHSTSDWS